jgi:uncharacterized protein
VTDGQRIAVIGSGIAGLSCAWLLGQRHTVTLYEADTRLGGHSCTVDVPRPQGSIAVDMGFIVYNEATYANLTALFRHLNVPTRESCMSLGFSLEQGGLEYGGDNIAALLAQRANLVRPRFWAMLAGLLRLYRAAEHASPPAGISLGDWLDEHRVPAAVQRDHLLPMAAAIWSCPPDAVRAQPALAFLRFCDTHCLLRLNNRPAWRTVDGGSREYIRRLRAHIAAEVLQGCEVVGIARRADGVTVRDATGGARAFDQVVLATHGDTALSLLDDADHAERAVLGAFRCGPNRAILHSDTALMPRRRPVWSSWNFLGRRNDTADAPCVTYWMNRLQNIPGPDLFVTLNPWREPAPGTVIAEQNFEHPLFDTASLRAQQDIWRLQGSRRTWFCGAWLGAGFHEDGLQAGLAVAERLGGVRRPWRVAGQSARLHMPAEMADVE